MSELYVVGIGPGSYENMTLRAIHALQSCDVIVGYHVYVDLVKEHFPDKEFHTTPMRREVDRCKIALDLARQGRDVAMICSGDAGVYGMAGLIYELRGEASDIGVEVVGGLTAAISGALTAAVNICAYVTFFRVAAALLPLPAPAMGALEMVGALTALPPGEEGFVMAAAVTAWGGLSIHCQTMSVTGTLSMKYYWTGKTVQTAAAAALAAVLPPLAL